MPTYHPENEVNAGPTVFTWVRIKQGDSIGIAFQIADGWEIRLGNVEASRVKNRSSLKTSEVAKEHLLFLIASRPINSSNHPQRTRIKVAGLDSLSAENTLKFR